MPFQKPFEEKSDPHTDPDPGIGPTQKPNHAQIQKNCFHLVRGDVRGIALFLVLASVAMLSILVTEFVYIANISQQIAFGGLDQTKAHYLAKTGLKISLLRLRAFQQVQNYIKKLDKSVAPPKSVIDRIWSFPFMYPIPTHLPGMSTIEKGMIEKFQKNSNLDGNLTVNIESESSKYNLNSLLEQFAASPTPTVSPSATPTDIPTFRPEEAQKNMQDYMTNILQQKMDQDQDFAATYRDLRISDLVSNIRAWVDRKFDYRPLTQDKIPMKQAPFYDVSELHMIPLMDDDLYELFAPQFTASTTGGVNINTIQSEALKALLPPNTMTKQELEEFFKFRDAKDVDNQFKSPDDFFKYLSNNVAFFKGNKEVVEQFKNDLAAKRIWMITDERNFKITVRANVNNANRTMIAWVTVSEPDSQQSNNPPPPGSPPPPPPPPNLNPTGLKITYMKIF